MTGDICSDDRFELIEKAKGILAERTNIEMRHDEMMVLDSILFRCWQMGWLDQLRENRWYQFFGTPERAARTVAKIIHCEADCGDGACSLYAFCNAYMNEEITVSDGYDKLLEWLRGDA